MILKKGLFAEGLKAQEVHHALTLRGWTGGNVTSHQTEV